MDDKIKNVIPLRIELIEIIIQCKRIHPHQAGHGEDLPHHVEIAEILDKGIANNEDMIVEHKIKSKRLGVNQQSDHNKKRTSQ